jgi:hypothetical protein
MTHNRKYAFQLRADHFQFYLEDAEASTRVIELWKTSTADNLVEIGDGIVAIGTARYGGIIDVSLEILDGPAQDALEFWDHVVECSLNLPSGELILSAPESDLSKTPRVFVLPDQYRVRIYFGNLDTVQDEFAKTGLDTYRIVMWPGEFTAPQIIK